VSSCCTCPAPACCTCPALPAPPLQAEQALLAVPEHELAAAGKRGQGPHRGPGIFKRNKAKVGVVGWGGVGWGGVGWGGVGWGAGCGRGKLLW
jgi:hypothetical protein